MLDTRDPILQPRKINGVWEFPVTVFADGTRIPRPQLPPVLPARCAAYSRHGASEWYAFTIVSHTFELLKRRRTNVEDPQADPIVVRRFEGLCEFLAANTDKFRTVGFADINPQEIPQSQPEQMLCGSGWRTGWRLVEQSIRRIY